MYLCIEFLSSWLLYSYFFFLKPESEMKDIINPIKRLLENRPLYPTPSTLMSEGGSLFNIFFNV